MDFTPVITICRTMNWPDLIVLIVAFASIALYQARKINETNRRLDDHIMACNTANAAINARADMLYNAMMDLLKENRRPKKSKCKADLHQNKEEK